jgi:hypothetical protein
MRSRSSLIASGSAVLLSLIIAGQALALSWSAAIPLTTTDEDFAFGIAGINSTTAVVANVHWNGSWYDIEVRRTTTSGSSWSGPTTLSTNGYFPDIAALDPFVDVVWEENGVVRYARSIDGGLTYLPSIPLSNPSFPLDLSVARGPGGLVVVAWENGNSRRIRARVSTDSGVTFGPTAMFDVRTQSMGTEVAAGEGVAYLAYKTRHDRVRVRRSTNGGASWSTAFAATNDGYGVVNEFSLTAVGNRAYLAYTVHNASRPAWGTIRYRRTLDSGVNWSAERQLSPAAWLTEGPDVTLQGGVLRAVFNRRTSGGYDVYYRHTTNGLTWGTSQLVDGSGYDPFVTKAGKVIVVFDDVSQNVHVRTGS